MLMFVQTLSQTLANRRREGFSHLAALRRQPVSYQLHLGRRSILVDTPGCDDICITDGLGEILRQIATWLAYS
jgi:hypothetical protein